MRMRKEKKKKKSEYQRLIDLLNEYEDPFVTWYVEYVEEFGMFILNNEQMTEEEIIISKNFWFIQRLVENDKIDRDNQAMQYAKSDLSKFFEEWKDKNWMSDDYAMLLMLLSIQDNPIEFLVSILK